MPQTSEYWKQARLRQISKNPEKYRLQRRIHARKYHERLMREAKDFLGNACVRCGFSDPRALQFDHVNGGGTQDNKKPGFKSLKIYRSVINCEGKFQLLCANCNWIKRIENNETNGFKE